MGQPCAWEPFTLIATKCSSAGCAGGAGLDIVPEYHNSNNAAERCVCLLYVNKAVQSFECVSKAKKGHHK